jgi:membrane-bound lytic murein transglycosylase B
MTVSSVQAATTQETIDQINEKNRQIQELQKQIDAYQQQIDQTRTKSSSLQNEINKLNAQIGQLNAEIKSLSISIDRTNLEISKTENQISSALDKLSKHKDALAVFLRMTYEIDQKSLTEVILDNSNLSDFFTQLHDLQATQESLQTTIDNIKTLKTELDEQKNELTDKKTDLQKLKQLQELQKKSLGGVKQNKDTILKETKGEESKYQQLVQKTQTDIAKLRNQIQNLQGIGVTVEDAVTYGKLAAQRAGIRPEFLIAILEIESGLGRNVGTGNWMDDMYNCYLRLGRRDRAETEKAAFLKIVGKLGLDPSTVKVSREPNYGCGGAMGPAQFIPSTWLGYEAVVTQLTGHDPANPWNIEDAFTASAAKLARGGATSKDRAGEIRAAKAYISGNGSCTSSICNSYSSAVLRKAEEIAPNL